jgi:hypothetical protein
MEGGSSRAITAACAHARDIESPASAADGQAITDPMDLRWDRVYRDATGADGLWRLAAMQVDGGEPLMRDWLPHIREWGAMVRPWDGLVEEYGPVVVHAVVDERGRMTLL